MVAEALNHRGGTAGSVNLLVQTDRSQKVDVASIPGIQSFHAAVFSLEGDLVLNEFRAIGPGRVILSQSVQKMWKGGDVVSSTGSAAVALGEEQPEDSKVLKGTESKQVLAAEKAAKRAKVAAAKSAADAVAEQSRKEIDTTFPCERRCGHLPFLTKAGLEQHRKGCTGARVAPAEMDDRLRQAHCDGQANAHRSTESSRRHSS